MDALELRLRREIMLTFAATGAPPERPLDPELLAELEQRHIVVLRDGQIHMAHPFAAHREGTRVESGGREWWGNCAWDGLGIVAALELREALVTSSTVALHATYSPEAQSGRGTVTCSERKSADEGGPRGTRSRSHGQPRLPVFEVRVPARHWWDDIEHT